MSAAAPGSGLRYDVEAFNTATASTNRIHDDDVARAYGFRGGLVPGVDVYAYLCHLPAEQWGATWLQGGGTIPEHRDRPEAPPDASADSLAPGTTLGSVTATFDASVAPEYLAAVREPLELYVVERLAHPGWLLRFANTVLAMNVRLGPWIHVSSDVVHGGLVVDGQSLDVRAVVLEEYERKGHRFVVLDVAIVDPDDGDVIQRITHKAIHTPRRTTD